MTDTETKVMMDETTCSRTPRKPYCSLKYALDFLFACMLLVVFAPLMLLVAILIKLDSRGPAIYRQARVGASGSIFTMLKFRTMKLGTPVLSTEDMQRQAIDPFTSIGPFLRKTSLDELPQLINVVKGEMTFIGPRPSLPTQNAVITLRAASGVDWIRPGITGLAQVMGRDDLDDRTKVAYDTEYCRHLGPISDLKILIRTTSAIISRRGNK